MLAYNRANRDIIEIRKSQDSDQITTFGVLRPDKSETLYFKRKTSD